MTAHRTRRGQVAREIPFSFIQFPIYEGLKKRWSAWQVCSRCASPRLCSMPLLSVSASSQAVSWRAATQRGSADLLPANAPLLPATASLLRAAFGGLSIRPRALSMTPRARTCLTRRASACCQRQRVAAAGARAALQSHPHHRAILPGLLPVLAPGSILSFDPSLARLCLCAWGGEQGSEVNALQSSLCGSFAGGASLSSLSSVPSSPPSPPSPPFPAGACDTLPRPTRACAWEGDNGTTLQRAKPPGSSLAA